MAGEIGQWLRALNALAEGLGLVPSIAIVTIHAIRSWVRTERQGSRSDSCLFPVPCTRLLLASEMGMGNNAFFYLIVLGITMGARSL